MNKTEFFKSLRRRESGVFGTSLSQWQVDRIDSRLERIEQGPIPIDYTDDKYWSK